MEVKDLMKCLQYLPKDAEIICEDETGKKYGRLYQVAIQDDKVKLIIK